ncbi:hypothetical protein PAAG_02750 [Paracoccidioides lutzii Pb01]|uniref:Uncharacterized protein n=1 Tax=Paracoccidioides lutzii (strain ATCC MYA-826 / Pb01) TaxID=502779 RepID=C1GW55_PARBA|nr:hypothetical protein PAAG_02750 [Paracoccidioides lutzii Pb01]EEH40774.2 hypothetical protein PAAG_02750 [Paracoccidioides lutzii Pb01]
MSEEEFQTYFPHVDNVYSHRSTQKYKRKLFVSHYWDCRLKGRPPGTPKSRDPSKKKRKRTARERDLCDVKIKITEYFPGALAVPPNLLGLDAMSSLEQNMQNAAAAVATGTDFLDPVVAGQNELARVANSNNPQPQAEPHYQFGVLTLRKTLPQGHPGYTEG